ncbi:hypothetical protein HNY73_013639 [Argiope bruennichi]|uniref:Uncharacterized protein n=1 Tax=Argiope bruennichi TaxID=94029 RepID=A0A8T0F4Q7_ARGBR|nr:hypothetical protein HNY73_013639 [Argiope bruennichi]
MLAINKKHYLRTTCKMEAAISQHLSTLQRKRFSPEWVRSSSLTPKLKVTPLCRTLSKIMFQEGPDRRDAMRPNTKEREERVQSSGIEAVPMATILYTETGYCSRVARCSGSSDQWMVATPVLSLPLTHTLPEGNPFLPRPNPE